MPLTHFLGLVVLVILAAGATLALAFAAVTASIILGVRQWR